jgi:hypothetical protein
METFILQDLVLSAMAQKYLDFFPKPLLDDLVAGKWLPIIGAGLSRNAALLPGKKMPLWNDLGEALGAELKDYEPVSTLDAISAFEHDYGRPKLMERLSQQLFVDEAKPGKVHEAFCSIQFDTVCTTNFDSLLERQYDQMGRVCIPLIDEAQLSVGLNQMAVGLLKLHGDLRHPDRLIVTEADYEGFIHRYPLLSTYLSNLLITRTAILVGYSLDDPDFRQIWRIVSDRLGRFRRPAYALVANASPTDISRYQRRGVRVINLENKRHAHESVLTATFRELAAYWPRKVLESSSVREEKSLQELVLPPRASARLTFFAIPVSLQSFYREKVFPIFREFNFIPVTADEVVAPGDAVQAKIEAIIERAFIVVADLSTPFTVFEWRFARDKLKPGRVLAIIGESSMSVGEQECVLRPNVASENIDTFLGHVRKWLERVSRLSRKKIHNEAERLLDAGEYRAAIIAAISALEANLRSRMPRDKVGDVLLRGIRSLVDQANQLGLLAGIQPAEIWGWFEVRNGVVHLSREASRGEATKIVRGVGRIIKDDDE